MSADHRWEYRRLTNWHPSEIELDKLGAAGWEMCGIGRDGEYVFKRPKRDPLPAPASPC